MRIAEYRETGMVYRDATPEEIAEFERQKAEMPEPEPTPEERLDALEVIAAVDEAIKILKGEEQG